MSLTFPTTTQKKPSGLTALPNKFKRPAFGTLYGYDAAGGVVESAAPTADDVLAENPTWWADPDPAYLTNASDQTGDDISDGDYIKAWTGRGNTAPGPFTWIQNTAAQQPVWKESGTNGKPYMDYTNANARMYDNSHSTTMNAGATTIYMVIAAVTSTSQNGKKILSTSPHITYAGVGSPVAYGLSTTFGSTNTRSFLHGGGGVLQSTDTKIIQLAVPGASGEATTRVNGGAAIGNSYSAGDLSDESWIDTTSRLFYIGVWAGATFLMYETIGINDITHDADVIFGYLGDKYDISVDPVE